MGHWLARAKPKCLKGGGNVSFDGATADVARPLRSNQCNTDCNVVAVVLVSKGQLGYFVLRNCERVSFAGCWSSVARSANLAGASQQTGLFRA